MALNFLCLIVSRLWSVSLVIYIYWSERRSDLSTCFLPSWSVPSLVRPIGSCWGEELSYLEVSIPHPVVCSLVYGLNTGPGGWTTKHTKCALLPLNFGKILRKLKIWTLGFCQTNFYLVNCECTALKIVYFAIFFKSNFLSGKAWFV